MIPGQPSHLAVAQQITLRLHLLESQQLAQPCGMRTLTLMHHVAKWHTWLWTSTLYCISSIQITPYQMLHAGMFLHAINAAYRPPENADSCTAQRASRQITNAAYSLTIKATSLCVCVCLQILHTGEISEQAPIPAVTESVLRSSELREGTTVSLDQQVTCSVAFAKGQERRVFFAVQGLPQVCICPQISSCCHIFVLYLIADGHLPTDFPLLFHLHSVTAGVHKSSLFLILTWHCSSLPR